MAPERSLPANGLFGALQFLTRVPIRLRSAPDLTAAVPWFPVVGALIGSLVGGAVAGFGELVPAGVAATLGVLIGMLVTGAFHEDGLADTADAMGGWTPERRREILEDSRHGSYGVAAMVATILLRVACLAALGPATAFAGAVAAHTLGRGAAVGVMRLAPSSPVAGLGSDSARSLSSTRAVIGVAVSVAIAGLALGWWIAPIALGVGAASTLVAVVATRVFEGISGDILGAVEQVGECVVLVIVSGLALHHSLWWT